MSRKYKTTNCLVCKKEFQKKGSVHFLCSNECFLYYRRNIRKKQKPASKEQRRKWYLKSQYGLSEEEWNSLFKKQDSRCAICRSNKPGNVNGWCTDHNHKTGKVRGILCHKCNTDIGGYERVISAERALWYLDYYKGE